MTELELKEKLLDAENLCPGMMPIDYDIARCLADYLNEPMTPRNFALFACLMVEDIRDVLIETDEVVLATYPKVFKKKGEKMLRNAQYILQIIDVVTEPEFADEVRQFLKVTMGWDVVKRVKAVDDREYPPHVLFAVDWWTGQIQRHERPKEMEGYRRPVPVKEFSVNEIEMFRDTLANFIMRECSKNHGYCHLEVGSYPNEVLSIAAKFAGVESRDLRHVFPMLTRMEIHEESIYLSVGYGPGEMVWHKTM